LPADLEKGFTKGENHQLTEQIGLRRIARMEKEEFRTRF